MLCKVEEGLTTQIQRRCLAGACPDSGSCCDEECCKSTGHVDWIDIVRQHQLQQLLQPSFNRHDNRCWFIYYLWSFGPRQYQSSLPNRILLVAAAAAFL